MEWREINGFENYLISSTGEVKSLARKVKRFNGKKVHDKTVGERILKASLSGSGYAFVCLRKDNRHHNKRIHVMVAESFIGERPSGLVINHKDGDKLNNNAPNLEYVSKQRNTQHHYQMKGKSCGIVKINEIPDIIMRVSRGYPIYKIAIEYGVTRNDIAVLCKIIDASCEELKIK